MKSKICQSCGNVFYKKENESVSYWDKKRFCSKNCANTKKKGITFANSGQFKKGENYWTGKHLSESHREKLSLTLKGKHLSSETEFRRGHEIRRKSYKSGIDNPKWDRVEKVCLICGEKFFAQKYRAENSKYCSSTCYHKSHFGENSPVWTDNYKNKFKMRIMQLPEYTSWRIGVFTRDGNKCCKCGATRDKEAHHIISFYSIVKKFNITTVEDARKCKELWDIANGQTLCRKCHRETDNYGNKSKLGSTGTV